MFPKKVGEKFKTNLVGYWYALNFSNSRSIVYPDLDGSASSCRIRIGIQGLQIRTGRTPIQNLFT
jgi:hypothetical protein